MRFAIIALATFGLLICGNSSLCAQPGEEVPELASILSLFSAHATDSDGVRLNWALERQSPTIIKFRIYRGYEEVGNFAVLTEIEARAQADSVEYSFTDGDAKPQVTYFYKIAAVGQKNESVFPVVISATPGVRGFKGTELDPAVILAGNKIGLYVRRAGTVKLEISGEKTLVNETLKPGIYEFDPPANAMQGLTLRLTHETGFRRELRWPVK